MAAHVAAFLLPLAWHTGSHIPASRHAVRFFAPVMLGVMGPRVQIVDDEGDPMLFSVTEAGVLQMYDRGELLCAAVKSISFSEADAMVSVDSEEVDAEFSVVVAEQRESLTRLALLAAESKVAWLGDEPVALPEEVVALLVDDELKASRPGVRILWLE
eukprot:6516922-Prymnesium_polylepis.1